MPKVKFPRGIHQIADGNGQTHIADDLGHADVPQHALRDLYAAGCTHAAAGHTSNRPAATTPGEMYYDTHLDHPIWRNAANDGWVDASGAQVPDDVADEAPEGPDDAESTLDPAKPKPKKHAKKAEPEPEPAPAPDPH